MKKIKRSKKLVIISFFILCVLNLSFITGCIDKERPKEDYDIYISLSHSGAKSSLSKAERWFTENLNEKGYFNYIYNPKTGNYSTENNMVRQLMASRLLAELSAENQSLQVMHEKNLEYIFSNWYEEENSTGYIFYDNQSTLGDLAMALRTIIYSPSYEEYADEAESICRAILNLQNNDGSLNAFYIRPNGSYTDYYFDYNLMFYSGEAILAFVEYYLKTGNVSYLDAAEKSQNYYIQKYVKEIDDNYNPVYVPWHTISLNKLYKITQNQNYSESIFTLNDKLIELQDNLNIETLGRFYNSTTPDYGNPHSASDGIYTEGLAYAYEIALMVNDKEHQDSYITALIIGMHNLISLQYNESSDEKTDGAIKVNSEDGLVRIDSTQHMIDAFRKSKDVIDSKEDEDWNYFYYPELDYLVKSEKRIIVRGNAGVWYALTIGTILTLIFVVSIYFIIRKKI